MTEIRPLGALLAGLGSIGLGVSAFVHWLGGRSPGEVPMRRLWEDGVTAEASSFWLSQGLPLVVAGLVGLAAVGLGSRTLLVASFLAGAGMVAWYMVRENEIRDELDGTDMPGAWVAIGSLAVMLVGMAALRTGTARRGLRGMVPHPGT